MSKTGGTTGARVSKGGATLSDPIVVIVAPGVWNQHGVAIDIAPLRLRSRSGPPVPSPPFFYSGEMGRVLGARDPWTGWQTPPEVRQVTSPAGGPTGPTGAAARLAGKPRGLRGGEAGQAVVSGRISVVRRQGETPGHGAAAAPWHSGQWTRPALECPRHASPACLPATRRTSSDTRAPAQISRGHLG